MRKTCSSGSVEGVTGNHDPYSDRRSPALSFDLKYAAKLGKNFD